MLVTRLRISLESPHIVLTLFVRWILLSTLFEKEDLMLEFPLFHTEETQRKKFLAMKWKDVIFQNLLY